MTPEERAEKLIVAAAADHLSWVEQRWRTAAAIREAVAEEREACAREADVYDTSQVGGETARTIAEAIRARGKV